MQWLSTIRNSAINRGINDLFFGAQLRTIGADIGAML